MTLIGQEFATEKAMRNCTFPKLPESKVYRSTAANLGSRALSSAYPTGAIAYLLAIWGSPCPIRAGGQPSGLMGIPKNWVSITGR
eukprot:g47280.t1